MRILVDYRAALRARTGVGEYMHALLRAYTAAFTDEVVLFTSSWKDRPAPRAVSEIRASLVDRRIPVRLLNLLWHRAEWPPIEWLAGAVDVAHSAHPLLIPARDAARLVTIHDLFFLQHPERTRAEIRRDYARLAGAHAHRADAIVTPSQYTATLVHEQLGVPSDAIHVCPPGPPSWESLGRGPHLPHDGCVLFLGTLEPRKNVGVLLDAYALLLGRQAAAPRLVLAGRATPEAAAWLDRLDRAPLRGRAIHIGYVPESQQEALFASARVLVLPSLDEGFGLPALAAMSAGIPVVASSRGSIPEVVGQAGILFDPGDAEALAQALERVTGDAAFAAERATAGLRQAQTFAWEKGAAALHAAYRGAITRRNARRETGQA